MLDLSRVLAGPWASQLLGDLGADVIKVKRPAEKNGKGGDDTRSWGPPWLADGERRPTADAAYFLCANRNKRSLAALAYREKTGQGQHIDLALLDVQVACLANQAMHYLVSGRAPRRLGNGHPNIVPYQDFPMADGDMILGMAIAKG